MSLTINNDGAVKIFGGLGGDATGTDPAGHDHSKLYESDGAGPVLTIGATSQLIFQPLVDATNIFQILDVDGGTPILNIDSTNERVGIGTSGPDAPLDILNASNPQLRLTHTDGSKFADFQVDTNHDLTIKPSSTGQIILQPTTDSTDFFQVLDADGGNPILNADAVNERIGIGLDDPSYQAEMALAAASNTFGISCYSDTVTHSGRLVLYKSHSDTLGATVETIDTEVIGTIAFRAVDAATTEIDTAYIEVTQVGAAGLSRTPSKMEFSTSTDTQTAVRMTITKEGYVGIGVTPTSKLHVSQPGSIGAIPALHLEQADLSEEIIRLEGESAAGTADQTLVDASDFTTPGSLLGWIKHEIIDNRVGGLGTIDAWVPFYAIPTA
jgi:hypothetical protein